MTGQERGITDEESLTSIYAAYLNGVDKEQVRARFPDEPGFDVTWADIEAEVARYRAADPDRTYRLDLPS